jgi:hypothetical protein
MSDDQKCMRYLMIFPVALVAVVIGTLVLASMGVK